MGAPPQASRESGPLPVAREGVAADDFRAVMGSFASGVTIVTAIDDAGRPFGLTATAFSSLSKDPPRCLVCVGRRVAAHAVMTATRRFAVNILGEQQQALSTRFGTRHPDKFAGVDWAPGRVTGCPVFPRALAWMECEVVEVFDGGDHDIFIGELLRTSVRQGEPLLYSRGRYGDFMSRPKS